jgi:methylase of polypeptide subunit release factors
MNWKLHAIGFHPWRRPTRVFSIPGIAPRTEEQGREPPYGRALDIGTGSAIWGIELAKRGWEVTGVDFVEKALARGRERVQAAGVEMKLVQGDVTRLSGLKWVPASGSS